MRLSVLQRKMYTIFGPKTEQWASQNLSMALKSAQIEMRPAAWLASALFYTLIALVASLVILSILLLAILPSLGLFLHPALIILGSLGIAGLTYLVFILLPASIAKTRGKKINNNLAYAMNFISAMSSAGVTPDEIFKSLSKQDIYGEIKNEASSIYRDVELMGEDIVTAVKKNIDRTPSEKFAEFLQGLIVTVTSGGSLKTYFVAKSNQFMQENRQEEKQLLETLGIMAESYVTAAVAGVLLLFIVIPIMMIINGDPSQLMFLYVLIFLVVPLIHMGFAFAIRSMGGE